MDSQKDTVNFMRIHVLRRYTTFGFWHQRFKRHKTVIRLLLLLLLLLLHLCRLFTIVKLKQPVFLGSIV